jgi:hypothetical protein
VSETIEGRLWISWLRDLQRVYPGMTLEDAARHAKACDPALAARVLEQVGASPSPVPELQALQAVRA